MVCSRNIYKNRRNTEKKWDTLANKVEHVDNLFKGKYISKYYNKDSNRRKIIRMN